MQRPDNYLDKFNQEMEKLYKSGSIKKGMKNLPNRKCFVENKEISPILEREISES